MRIFVIPSFIDSLAPDRPNHFNFAPAVEILSPEFMDAIFSVIDHYAYPCAFLALTRPHLCLCLYQVRELKAPRNYISHRA
jgi:hypothetical protein